MAGIVVFHAFGGPSVKFSRNFLTDAPEVMCLCMPSLHKIGISCSDGARFASVSQHHANARPDATTQGNQQKTLRRGRRTALQRTAFQSSMLRRYTIGSRYAIDSRCAPDSGYVAGLGCADFSGQTRYFVGDPSFRVTTVVRRNLRFS